MKRLQRLKLLWLNSYIGPFMLIAVIYGILFGGPTAIFSKSMDLVSIILSITGSMFFYFSIFILGITALYIGLNVKVLLSFGISRKDSTQIWNDILLYGTLFISGFSWLYFTVIVKRIQPGFGARVLNMDMNALSLNDHLRLVLLLGLTVFLLLNIFSFVTAVGGKYGILCIVGMISLVIAAGLFLVPLIVGLVVWGTHYYAMIVGLAAAGIILWSVTRHYVIRMEVSR